MEKTLKVKNTEVGQRLDVFCVSKIPQFSRALLQKAIKNGEITVNEKQVKPKHIVRENDVITITLKDTSKTLEAPAPPNISIPVIYEDKEVVVINKPAGIVVHPGVAKEQNTVSSWFIEKHPESIGVGDSPIRPGIVHRLDKDTSGTLILAKTQESFEHLKQQFKKHRVKKEYSALVFGVPKAKEGRINQPIGRSRRNPLRRAIDPEGKPAITEWQLDKKISDKFSLLKAFPLTGRTHQIRVHFHFLGHPIVGDTLYTFKRQRSPQGVSRQLLHAEKLTLTLLSGKRKSFAAPLPADFTKVINSI
jgi:23S rRNA pseudouridine1911/1915/1917 synthase